jgi:hypothetical protein
MDGKLRSWYYHANALLFPILDTRRWIMLPYSILSNPEETALQYGVYRREILLSYPETRPTFYNWTRPITLLITIHFLPYTLSALSATHYYWPGGGNWHRGRGNMQNYCHLYAFVPELDSMERSGTNHNTPIATYRIVNVWTNQRTLRFRWSRWALAALEVRYWIACYICLNGIRIPVFS